MAVVGTQSFFTRAGGCGAEQHSPRRPDWVCTECGRLWPCPQARADLAASLPAGTALAEYMAGNLYVAAADLTTITPRELYERFVAWTRPQPNP